MSLTKTLFNSSPFPPPSCIRWGFPQLVMLFWLRRSQLSIFFLLFLVFSTSPSQMPFFFSLFFPLFQKGRPRPTPFCEPPNCMSLIVFCCSKGVFSPPYVIYVFSSSVTLFFKLAVTFAHPFPPTAPRPPLLPYPGFLGFFLVHTHFACLFCLFIRSLIGVPLSVNLTGGVDRTFFTQPFSLV